MEFTDWELAAAEAFQEAREVWDINTPQILAAVAARAAKRI